MKYTILFFLLGILAVSGCKKTTFADVYDEMTITVVGKDALYADSVSTAYVDVDFGKNLVKEQVVTITTSAGLLYKLPYTPDSTGAKSVTLKPFDDKVRVLLQSDSREPADRVYVSATINGYTETEEIAFMEALPDDLLLMASKLDLTVVDTHVVIRGELFRDVGYVSHGIRFDVLGTLERFDTAAVDLRWSLPEFVFSSGNVVEVPLGILDFSPGSALRVRVVGGGDGAGVEGSLLFCFE